MGLDRLNSPNRVSALVGVVLLSACSSTANVDKDGGGCYGTKSECGPTIAQNESKKTSNTVNSCMKFERPDGDIYYVSGGAIGQQPVGNHPIGTAQNEDCLKDIPKTLYTEHSGDVKCEERSGESIDPNTCIRIADEVSKKLAAI